MARANVCVGHKKFCWGDHLLASRMKAHTTTQADPASNIGESASAFIPSSLDLEQLGHESTTVRQCYWRAAVALSVCEGPCARAVWVGLLQATGLTG